MSQPPKPMPPPDDSEGSDLDDALEDTFPASDPPSQTDPTHGVGGKKPTP